MKLQLVIFHHASLLLLCNLRYVSSICPHMLPVVNTPNGKIQGTYETDLEGRPYMQFLGVPFAKPPVGKLRFAEPEAMQPWDHTWIANSTNICLQVDHAVHPQEGQTKGEEDCLYLNVFVPGVAVVVGKHLDVMIHIHGGAWMFGSSITYAWPTRFMNKGVIFVTVNYRLGVFGFLSTEDKLLPGNLGMKDQTMALKWVQTHIQSFGGNPKSVTISGISAGAASVHFHLLSPLSRGLFHRAISCSGNALAPWAIYEEPLPKAKCVGEYVGCQYQNSKDFLRCLRQRPASQLVEATKLFRTWLFVPFSPFGVIVDSYADKPFLPDIPYKLINERKVANVPWLASVATAEGLYPVTQLPQRKEYFDELENNWNTYLPPLLHYDLTIPRMLLSEVSGRIKEEYLGNCGVSKESFPDLIQLVGDRLFVHSMQKAVKLHAAAIKSPVYFYVYDYFAEDVVRLPYLFCGDATNYGVSHADDSLLTFEHEGKGSERDLKIMQLLHDLWLSIMKSGKPHMATWPAVSKSEDDPIKYMYIGDCVEVRTSKDLTRNKSFWDCLPFEENENLLIKPQKTEL